MPRVFTWLGQQTKPLFLSKWRHLWLSYYLLYYYLVFTNMANRQFTLHNTNYNILASFDYIWKDNFRGSWFITVHLPLKNDNRMTYISWTHCLISSWQIYTLVFLFLFWDNKRIISILWPPIITFASRFQSSILKGWATRFEIANRIRQFPSRSHQLPAGLQMNVISMVIKMSVELRKVPTITS